jgi:rhodanese-related sulfurtransferase
MASKQQSRSRKGAAPTKTGRTASRASSSGSSGIGLWVIGGLVAMVAVVLIAVFVVNQGPSTGTATTVQGVGGTWTDISTDRLATEMKSKDFTLLNVKTPYIGEIDGTDLYIPYDQLAARAAELPADKSAKLVVYCRTGNESTIASQTLLDLGYTNIENLEGGMVAWTASGRHLVDLGRS